MEQQQQQQQPQHQSENLSLSPQTSSQLEQVTLEISRKEMIQTTQRQTCSNLFDEIQKYQSKITQYQKAIDMYTKNINDVRHQVRHTQEELQLIDSDLEGLQKKRYKMVMMAQKKRQLKLRRGRVKSEHGNGNGNGGNSIGEGQEGDDDDDDMGWMESQYAANLTQDGDGNGNGDGDDLDGNRDGGEADVGAGMHRAPTSAPAPLHEQQQQQQQQQQQHNESNSRSHNNHNPPKMKRHNDGYEDIDMDDINREIEDHYAQEEEDEEDYNRNHHHHHYDDEDYGDYEDYGGSGPGIGIGINISRPSSNAAAQDDNDEDEEVEWVSERNTTTSTTASSSRSSRITNSNRMNRDSDRDREDQSGNGSGRFHRANTPAGLVPSVSLTPPPSRTTSTTTTTTTTMNNPYNSNNRRTTLHDFFGGGSGAGAGRNEAREHQNIPNESRDTGGGGGVGGGGIINSSASASIVRTSTSASSPSIFPPNIRQHFQNNSINNYHYNGNGNGNNNNNIYNYNNNNTNCYQGTFQTNLRRPRYPQERNGEYLRQLSSNNFPWSTFLQHTLTNTFHIAQFRNHQKEIINCTLSGDDTFVIMRTGGGKSLTYQLPALMEGKSHMRKITLVISPLLALIKDQEEQMNAICPNSATSFTSTVPKPEQTRRWNLLRDGTSGICIVFVTPERVSKSQKLKHELEKLDRQNRLGRFVIDECHCCSNWGHDFRPDYTQLGVLKQYFPHIPLIAVTATASDRVREDCCRLLNIPNYQFFRSSANRPNLKYSIRNKPDSGDKLVNEMAEFIKEYHPDGAGIIYTFSKREANTVAAKLGDFGITARAYHSDVSDSAKETIHRSWMRNRTQVVVATIAFGLGINKPDVRFVLHHSLSKSIEAYYQESGRAGRDGNNADCVLFYSPKDISRTIGMIHGAHGEGPFWSMARYAQAHGDDSLCRRIILSVLGEPGCESLASVMSTGTSNTEEREVGKYAKDVVRLIQCAAKDVTMAQVVTIWRSNGEDTPDFVKENPPKADLTKDECERLIVALILENILCPKVVRIRNVPNSIVYIECKEKAYQLLTSPNPKVKVRFPVRVVSTTARKKKDNGKNKKSPKNGEDGWMSKKKSSSSSARKKGSKNQRKRSSSSSNIRTKKSTKGRNSTGGDSSSTCNRKKAKRVETEYECEVIDIDDSDDDEVVTAAPALSFTRSSRTRSHGSTGRTSSVSRSSRSLDNSDSDSEFEFD